MFYPSLKHIEISYRVYMYDKKMRSQRTRNFISKWNTPFPITLHLTLFKLIWKYVFKLIPALTLVETVRFVFTESIYSM